MEDQVTSIEQSRRLLELKDISAYLPYGLKVQDRDMDIWLLSQLGNANSCMDGDIGLCTDDAESTKNAKPKEYSTMIRASTSA